MGKSFRWRLPDTFGPSPAGADKRGGRENGGKDATQKADLSERGPERKGKDLAERRGTTGKVRGERIGEAHRPSEAGGRMK